MAVSETWAGPEEGRPGVAETHVSWLYFTPDRVFKVKKPVDLAFVDFSTPAARLHSCQEEVRLNRRLAPDVYEGVAHLVMPDGRDEPLVAMRRMPASRRLALLVVEGASGVESEIEAIARILAEFHRRAERSADIDRDGTPGAVTRLWDDNLREMAPFDGTVLAAGLLDRIGRLARRYVATRSGLLEDRVGDGRVCDGHGDLLADDIFCLPDGPRILDCLEFDPRLRHGDVLADVAFLAMDLESLGRPELGDLLLGAYQAESGDRWPASLAHHWIAYRALVRCKIACLRAAQGHASARADAGRLARLCLDHLRQADVRLVLVGGSPGTGKSTLAAGLGERLGWPVLRSDVLRKELAGLDPRQPADAPFGTGLYEAEWTAAVYAQLLGLAGVELVEGQSVIIDASWSRRCFRDAAAARARSAGAELVMLRCHVPVAVAESRIERRRRVANPSDATVAVAATMRLLADPWPEAAVVDTSGPASDALEEALQALGLG